jgi:hypothetical protein
VELLTALEKTSISLIDDKELESKFKKIKEVIKEKDDVNLHKFNQRKRVFDIDGK